MRNELTEIFILEKSEKQNTFSTFLISTRTQNKYRGDNLGWRRDEKYSLLLNDDQNQNHHSYIKFLVGKKEDSLVKIIYLKDSRLEDTYLDDWWSNGLVMIVIQAF